MNLRLAVCFLLLGPAAMAARAETVTCPDLGAAVQVGTCPAEEELRYTFGGYCGDNSRMYRGENDVCADYQSYRKLKNVVMWESADGRFHAYLSCDLPAAALSQARPATMSVGKQGKITRLACSYGEGMVFSYRSRGECKVQGGGDCTAAACSAICE